MDALVATMLASEHQSYLRTRRVELAKLSECHVGVRRRSHVVIRAVPPTDLGNDFREVFRIAAYHTTINPRHDVDGSTTPILTDLASER